MKKTDLQTTLAILLMATVSSCYNLAPDNNAGALTSAEIYSGVGNVLNIDSLVDYVKAIKQPIPGYYTTREDIDIDYRYDGKHHKTVRIACDRMNPRPVKMTGNAKMDSILQIQDSWHQQQMEQNDRIYEALSDVCKSLACSVKPSNSSMWETHHDDSDSVQYRIALREYPLGDTLKIWNGRKGTTSYSHAPEIVEFFFNSRNDSISRMIGREGYGSFTYEFSPDSVQNETHVLLDKKGFIKRLKPVFKQKGIESREIYITRDANCSIKPTISNVVWLREYITENPADTKELVSETRGTIYTMHSRALMESVMNQLKDVIWQYIDENPYMFYTFAPDQSLPDPNFSYGSIKDLFTMDQYTLPHEACAIFFHQYQDDYNILVLDTTGNLWLPIEWPIMKSWKNGQVTLNKNIKITSELTDRYSARFSHESNGYPVWDESSIVKKNKK